MYDYLPLICIPLAFLLDVLFGELPGRIHPLCFFGRWAKHIESYCKKSWGKTYLSGFIAGLICTIIPTLIITSADLVSSIILPLLTQNTSVEALQSLFSYGLFTLVLYLCIAPKSLIQHGLMIYTALASSDIKEARQAVSYIVGRDTQEMDRSAIIRAAIESISENLTDAFLSPLFYALIACLIDSPMLGIVLVLLHRQFNTLDALWGKKNDEYRYFGTFVARTDDVLNFIPARCSLFIIALTALFLPYCSAKKALSIGWKYRHDHASPNSPWSEAAYAGALHLTLSGPITYKGISAPYPYLGEGTLHPTSLDLKKALSLTLAACITAIILAEIILFIPIYY